MGQIIGQNEHRYEVVEGWGRLPDGIRYGYTHGVCEDSQGRIYIFNQSRDAMIVFDAEGTFIQSWGGHFAQGAHGLTLNRENGGEFLYLCDEHHNKVYKTTLDGEILWEIGVPKEAGVYDATHGFKPTNTAVAANGDVYIADGYGSSYVHQYNSNADYIRTWGGEGSEPGKLMCPHGICIDRRSGQEKVLIADRGNVRLQWFTMEGEFDSMADHDLRHPCHFDIFDQTLLIPDLFGRVTLFGEDNQLLVHLGSDRDLGGDEEWIEPEGYPNVAPETLKPGKFSSPHSACFDSQGNIYVVEWIDYGRVTKLKKI